MYIALCVNVLIYYEYNNKMYNCVIVMKVKYCNTTVNIIYI